MKYIFAIAISLFALTLAAEAAPISDALVIEVAPGAQNAPPPSTASTTEGGVEGVLSLTVSSPQTVDFASGEERAGTVSDAVSIFAPGTRNISVTFSSDTDAPGPAPDLGESISLSYRFLSDPATSSDVLQQTLQITQRGNTTTTTTPVKTLTESNALEVGEFDVGTPLVPGGPPVETIQVFDADGTLSDTLTISGLIFGLFSDGDDCPTDIAQCVSRTAGAPLFPDESGLVLTIQAFSDITIPEPTSLSLLSIALFGLGATVRWKSRRFTRVPVQTSRLGRSRAAMSCR